MLEQVVDYGLLNCKLLITNIMAKKNVKLIQSA